MFALAQRNGIALPFESVEALRRAYQFTQLQDFLDIYYQGMAVLITEQDFFDLAWAYLRARAGRQCAPCRDVLRSAGPYVARRRLRDRGERPSGAIARARRELGVSASLIMCFLRHLDEDDAQRTLDSALAHRDKIIGVGLDSSERGHPPAKFARVFARAREAGFFLFAHAGEEGPPAYVWEAIDVLGVARVDHGNRSLEDDALVARLARDRKPLTVCPLSNLRLRVVHDLGDHPLRRMMEKDLLVTLNSDDPAYFGGYVNDNFRAVERALNLSRAELVAVARNSFVASMMPEAEKARALAEFDRAVASSA